MMRIFLLLPFLVICFVTPAAGETRASDRVALVIGMSTYSSVPPLKNTLSDVKALAADLKTMGFAVDISMDATKEETLAQLQDFAFKAETADLALIYYAGHGVSVQGTTFLIPIDAQVQSAKDIVTASVTMDQMLSAVDGARKMSILILDSCRDNPFPDVIDLRDPEVAKGLTTGKGGLAAPSPERGTLVAFAARDGAVALDGDGENSPFNIALRKNIVIEGLEIGLMFRQVRDDVLAATGNAQEPATYGSLPGQPFFLTGGDAVESEAGVEDLAMAWARIVDEDLANLQRLADAGDSRSVVGLALAKLDRQHANYDPSGAVALLEQAAAQGDPEAQYRLAKVLEGGFGVTADPARALGLYQASADAGIAAAVNDMGVLTYFGELGLTADKSKALGLFRQAADLGHTEAMVNVASFAANGLIEDMGPDEAANLIYGALRGGSARALEEVLARPEAFPKQTWAALQGVLAEKGLYEGEIDGSFGPGTRRAVLAAYGIFEAE
ncbi:caspase family protein [Xinfangfangia sp. CPCC 101601]|uniref:Caspase family protein n=1 Tax=Pseudogemmobacter lacusdianii TaxID=3069608 RepID=A0ABU0W084_9RHOB|nr:caspase family protein [Xinfangfangia sp. CPCC 101601]MDQ2066540.1 caspase family protein [Xinfangfangia sp. CPCC 101601]